MDKHASLIDILNDKGATAVYESENVK